MSHDEINIPHPTMETAIDAYKRGRPVMVFSVDHKLLHGGDDLTSIVKLVECFPAAMAASK